MKNVVLFILLAGCGSSNSKFGDDNEGDDTVDAGTDAGTTDAGTTDAGTTDAGTTDAASPPDAFVCQADTQNDSNNCGACGRSCLGLSCSVGRCESQRLDNDDIKTIGDFTADNLFVYYTGFALTGSTPHRLWRRVIGPATSPGYLTTFGHPTKLTQFSFDGTDFYTVEPGRIDTVNRGTIKKTNKDPFTELTLAGFQPPTTTAIVKQGGFVYYATDLDGGNGGDIKRVSTTGGATSTITVLAGVVAYLGADATDLFWVDDGGGGIPPALHRAPIAGGTTVDVAAGIADFLDMDATRVYMVKKNTGELVSVLKTGGAVTVLGSGMTTGGAVDDDHVYAAQSNKLVGVTKTGTPAGTLWEKAPGGTVGCPVTFMVTRAKVIGQYVYFLVVPKDCNGTESANQLYRIARM